MNPYLTHYQSANITDDQSIQNFVVRKKEFERVMSDIRTTNKESSFQHYVFVGRRGSGKSTLLRRIQAEVTSDKDLENRLLVTNLSEEQAGIYKLYDLWDYVLRALRAKGCPSENPDWQDYADDMKAYTHKLYSVLSESLKKADKQLIVLIDNIDRIFKNIGDDAALLREQLMNYNDVRIIGGSTVMSESYWRYDMPFYQFFSIKRLGPLKTQEIKELLAHWSKEKDIPEIGTFVDKYPGKLQAIRMLTDGTPRTMLLFVEMLINRPLQRGFDYLTQIIDQATPIYQERLGLLSSQQQKILVELSFFWEATPVEQLIGVCKMPGKTISSQLSNLVKAHLVEKVKGPTKNHFYRLEERFFNLWLLMTQGGPKQKRDAKYLTIFLENWYDQTELKTVYNDFVSDLKTKGVKTSYALSMTKALAHSKYLTFEERDEIINYTRKTELSDDMKLHLPELSSDILDRAEVMYNDGQFEDAYQLVNSIEQEDGVKSFALAQIAKIKGETELAEKYYLQAIDKGHSNAMNSLAILYAEQEKSDLAEEYWLRASENGLVDAKYNLAKLYEWQGRLELAEESYLKVIERGDAEALFRLAFIYEAQGKTELAERYYRKAVENGHVHSYNNLALLFYDENRNIVESSDLIQKRSALKEPLALNEIVNESIIQLWSGRLELFDKGKKEVLDQLIEVQSNYLDTYLTTLLIHHQKNYVLGLFEKSEHSDFFKSTQRPLYYVTLKLVNPEDSRLLKAPPELEENIQDILDHIIERQAFYAS